MVAAGAECLRIVSYGYLIFAWGMVMRLGLGPKGVYWSIVIAETTAAIVAIWLFRRGTWKAVQV